MVKKSVKDRTIEKILVSDKSISTSSVGVSNLNSVKDKTNNSDSSKNIKNSKNKEQISKIYEVNNEKYFILCTGKNILSIRQLLDELLIMPQEVFTYHVNDSKNDFANWIYYVFNDEELSKKISESTNQKDLIISLSYYILKNLERDGK